jgi:hypothetical protein
VAPRQALRVTLGHFDIAEVANPSTNCGSDHRTMGYYVGLLKAIIYSIHISIELDFDMQ